MKHIIVFLALALSLSACGNKLEKEREMNFSCTQDVKTYFLSARDIIQSGGFAVTSVDEKGGYLSAEKTFAHKKDSVTIFLDLHMDQKRDIRVRTTALIATNKNSKSREYYNLEEYNDDYKSNFLETLKMLKEFCSGPKFPNRP